jgi:hypothetical protein
MHLPAHWYKVRSPFVGEDLRVMKSREPESGPEEIAARRDAALLRALSTPHKKQADMKKGKRGSAPADPRRGLSEEADKSDQGK